MNGSRRAAARIRMALRRALALVGYGCRLLVGRPAGRLGYHLAPAQPVLPPPWLELRVPSSAVSATEARAWCALQTLRELVVSGVELEEVEATAGASKTPVVEPKVAWRVSGSGPAAAADTPWVLVAPSLPELPPSHLESTLLVAAAEEVDGVLNLEGLREIVAMEPDAIFDGVVAPELRPFLVVRRQSPFAQEASFAAGSRVLLKSIGTDGVAPAYEAPPAYGRKRRGPYVCSHSLGPELSVGVRDPSRLLVGAAPRDGDGEAEGAPLLVLTSFLATGGAEHTLFETLRALRGRFALTFATLAPHRAERGDRRADFRDLSERLYCLGDLVHPAAMVGILLYLVDRYGVRHVYNANGTTLFYEFAPQLKAARPELRIVDHLYDHRVGYIDRYTPELMRSVDACVAENHRIAQVLVEERGWEPQRVPVIWPCGRASEELPLGPREAESRRRARRLFDAADGDLVLLTAARMHPQKRPLDLVALAQRFGAVEGVRFVIVGGGDLEGEVDAAIATVPGIPIRRLPFRTDVPELIAGADVGCLVSDYEGLPVFMIECLQMGRPFLGTAVGEMGRVLRETGAGIVVEEPGDILALEQAVRSLLDPAVRAGLAERARVAARRFEVASCAEAYARAFVG